MTTENFFHRDSAQTKPAARQADNILMKVCPCGCGRVTLHLCDADDNIFADAFVDGAMLYDMYDRAVYETAKIRDARNACIDDGGDN